LGPAPQKILVAKYMLNLARFQTHSQFELEYLWNGQRYPKSGNYLTDSISSRVWRKKVWWTLVHYPQRFRSAIIPTKSTLSEDHISAPRGCCTSKFLHMPQNGQVFLAHIPWDGGSPNNFLVVVKNCLKMWATITLELRGIASRYFAQDVLLDRGVNPCTTFGGHFCLKIWEGKNIQNLVQFRTTFNFECYYLWNGWSYRQVVNGVINYCFFCIEQKMMNFGPLTTKLCLHILTYPKSTVCAFSDNFWLWPRISLERIKISTSG